MTTEEAQQRKRLHREYKEATVQAQTYSNTPYGDIMRTFADEALEELIQWYEKHLGIASNSDTITLRK